MSVYNISTAGIKVYPREGGMGPSISSKLNAGFVHMISFNENLHDIK